ncbi:DUF302 domain-containing protein [Ectothiorhodospira marina]|jgi:uncharacterized protein (DUF302 family)|uniref:DUF302 domain-containing protein n=1 Tax=Ectothiorhodospira marina TaxID=1396821 RepID=A0A1H7F686_9GAMM|nr:DUF302 domain-containing protein [Ectothiorhodospira marina]SEK20887.1 protein of unknown function DUF302 [Ectothiorhodospira marina]
MPRTLILLSALMGLILAAPAPATEPHRDTDHLRVYSIEGDFEWYREALEMAIVNRGIVINNVAHIGAMLSRTGADVGGEALFKDAQALEFCSAGLSRGMMEADPHNIVFCPYVVAVYETEEAPGVIHLGYRRPAMVGDANSRQALQAVEDLLDDIVREALMF